MRLYKKIFLLLFLYSLSTFNFATESTDISAWLSGSTSREWTKVRWEAILDSSGACSQGEAWTFHRNGNLEIRQCLNGKSTTQKKQWHREKNNKHYARISIDDKLYEFELLVKNESAITSLPPHRTYTAVIREERIHTTQAVKEIQLSYTEY